MYPEKLILDVAGFPTIKGRDLVAGLVEQAASAQPGRTSSTARPSSLTHDDDARRPSTSTTAPGSAPGR